MGEEPTRATRATRQPAKLFGRRRWLRLGFMRLNFTPYCVVAAGGLKTISDGILFYLFIVDSLLFISIRQWREQPKPHSNWSLAAVVVLIGCVCSMVCVSADSECECILHGSDSYSLSLTLTHLCSLSVFKLQWPLTWLGLT